MSKPFWPCGDFKFRLLHKHVVRLPISSISLTVIPPYCVIFVNCLWCLTTLCHTMCIIYELLLKSCFHWYFSSHANYYWSILTTFYQLISVSDWLAVIFADVSGTNVPFLSYLFDNTFIVCNLSGLQLLSLLLILPMVFVVIILTSGYIFRKYLHLSSWNQLPKHDMVYCLKFMENGLVYLSPISGL